MMMIIIEILRITKEVEDIPKYFIEIKMPTKIFNITMVETDADTILNFIDGLRRLENKPIIKKTVYPKAVGYTIAGNIITEF